MFKYPLKWTPTHGKRSTGCHRKNCVWEEAAVFLEEQIIHILVGHCSRHPELYGFAQSTLVFESRATSKF